MMGDMMHADTWTTTPYTRAAAIASGELVDLSIESRAAGIPCPVAVTAEVWQRYLATSPQVGTWRLVTELRQALEGLTDDATRLFRVPVRFDGRATVLTGMIGVEMGEVVVTVGV